jgi:tetratricopeptide (TPR) repeat protein
LTGTDRRAKLAEVAMKPAVMLWLSASLAWAVPAPAAQAPDVPLAVLEESARRDSNDAEALYHLGVAYAHVGRRDDAKRFLFAAVRTDPQFAPGYAALSQLYPRSLPGVLTRPGSDSSDVLSHRAFQINPFLEVTRPSQFDLPMYWRGTLQLALRHFHDGKDTAAFDEFGFVIQRDVRWRHAVTAPPVALWYHMLTAIRLGRSEAAIRDGETMLDAALRAERAEATNHATRMVEDLQYVLANLHHAAGHTADAERLYRLVVERDLGMYMAHARLAQMYGDLGRWDDAINEREMAIAANPDDPSLVYDLGQTLATAGHLAEAETVLRRAIAGNPRESRAAYALGVVDASLGRTADARAAFTSFLALAPGRYRSLVADVNQRLAALP